MNLPFALYKIEEILSKGRYNYRDLFKEGEPIMVNLNSILSTVIPEKVELNYCFDDTDTEAYAETIDFFTGVLDAMTVFLEKMVKGNHRVIFLYCSDWDNLEELKYVKTEDPDFKWYPQLTDRDKNSKGFHVFNTLLHNTKVLCDKYDNSKVKFVDIGNLSPFMIASQVMVSTIYLSRDPIDMIALSNGNITIYKHGIHHDAATDLVSMANEIQITPALLPLYLYVTGLKKRNWKGIPGVGPNRFRRLIIQHLPDIMNNDYNWVNVLMKSTYDKPKFHGKYTDVDIRLFDSRQIGGLIGVERMKSIMVDLLK